MLDCEEFEQRRWRVVVLAHAARRRDLVEFLRRYRVHVAGWRLEATGETAAVLRAEAGLRAIAAISAAGGAEVELGERITAGQIDALIILVDPLAVHAGEFDAAPLLRAADVVNLPVATNLATAHCLVMGLDPTLAVSSATK